MRNRELCEKYRNFIIASLNLLGEISENGKKIPVVVLEKMSVKREIDRVEYPTELIQEPDFSELVNDNKDEIRNLSEFAFCLDFLIHQKEIELKSIREDLGETYLFSVLRYYLRKARSLDFNERVFKEVYAEVENHLYTGISKFLAKAYLHNFEMENNELDLDNLKIRKITDEEISEIYRQNKRSTLPMMPFREAINAEYLMEQTYAITKGEGINDLNARENFGKLVSALRLFRNGDVYFRRIISYPASWQLSMMTFSGGELFHVKYGEKYKLKKSEIEDFKKFWKDLLDPDFGKNKFLETAIERFDYGCQREKLEDKIIDYMIALEALFLSEGSELSYRLSIRSGLFLDRNKKVYEDVKRAYDLRSKIVHGSTEPLPEDFGQLVLKIEEYLRESIKRFLSLTKMQSYEEIIESTDKQIFI